jgi:uncharacterized repeat protein (TIGR03847 family)
VNDRRLDLGPVESVRAESFGEPGQRTFRLLAHAGEGTVSLWLEKQQLAMLGAALEDLLERTPRQHEVPMSDTDSSGFVGDLEVRVGSLAVGFDPEGAGFSLEAAEFTSALGLSSIVLNARRDQFASLEQEISEIVSKIRPRCALCGQPLSIDPHFCPESNGHARVDEA